VPENEQNNISIEKIELAVFHRNLPGNSYNSYSEGRGVCGLVVAISGDSTYIFKDGTKQKIYAGQAALFSDKVAYIVTNKNQSPFVHYTINFTLTQDSFFKSDVLIKPINFTEFSEKCECLLNLWNSGEPMSGLRCMSVLYELIADVLENNLITNIGENAYHTVLPAIHYIDENFSSEISISTLARLCVMSDTNFRRVFKAVCGISPIQYLLNVRIRRAKEFLTHHNYSVADVSRLCGFKDVEHFCRTFKKRTGTTPKQTCRISE